MERSNEERLLDTSIQESSGFLTTAQIKVLAWFLFYSIGMFSLPFLSFIGAKHGLVYYFGITGFPNTVWSVIAAVVTVNAIIFSYACKGFREEQEEIYQQNMKSKFDFKKE